MNLILQIIRKLFLVKEIISKQGKVHFRRYRLLETPWLRLYIHQICRSDEDWHLHTHPWNFISFLLKGSYKQECFTKSHFVFTKHNRFDVVKLNRHDAHSITLCSDEVWSFFIAYGKRSGWGYILNDQSFIDHESYRTLKNEGKLR